MSVCTNSKTQAADYLWAHIVKSPKKATSKNRGSQDVLLYPWQVASQSQEDPVLVTVQNKKHLDQKKHEDMQNTKLKQKIKDLLSMRQI